MKFSQVATVAAALGLMILCTINSPVAVADDSGWYVGGNFGQSRTKIDDRRITSGLASSGFDTTSIRDDERHFGFELHGGYQFNRYFALEGGYFDLGKFGFTANTVPAGTLRGEAKVKGADFDVLGILPFTEQFSAFALVGGNYADVRDRFAGTGAVIVSDPDRHRRASHYKFGVGLEYDFIRTFGVRAEAQRYRIDDAVGNRGDIDLLSLGFVYRFRGNEPAARAEAPSPPPPVDSPAPVLVVVPTPPSTQQYCSILDIQFEINGDEIQRQEKEKLGVLGTFLTKYTDTTAVIEGHTDNVGAAEQNMKLSERRAQSVVSYLEDHFHIAPARLSAVGYGETRPLADNRTEEGKRRNRRIGAVIACATDIEGLTVQRARVTMALLIEFDRNRAEVKPQYREELHKVASFLTANPSVSATVEGHTGNLQATRELSLEISRQRAQSVVNYLVDNFGIARSRLTAEGFGQNRRFAYNTSLEGQQENRRVNIIIDYP